jgi:hypothetical protein
VRHHGETLLACRIQIAAAYACACMAESDFGVGRVYWKQSFSCAAGSGRSRAGTSSASSGIWGRLSCAG